MFLYGNLISLALIRLPPDNERVIGEKIRFPYTGLLRAHIRLGDLRAVRATLRGKKMTSLRCRFT